MAKVSAKDALIIVGGYQLSADVASYEIDASVEPVEVTGFGEGWRNYVPGPFTGSLTLETYWNSAAGRSAAAGVLKPLANRCVTVIPDGYAAGNPCISIEAETENFTPGGSSTGALMGGSIRFQTSGTDGGPLIGQVITHAIVTSTTTTAAVQDFETGIVATARCAGILHIWDDTDTDTYVVKIQHSNLQAGVYNDLVTFTLNGTALGSEKVEVASGAIQPWRRVVATRTGAAGDNFGFTVAFWHA
jgi:hypothetical protein